MQDNEIWNLVEQKYKYINIAGDEKKKKKLIYQTYRIEMTL